MGNFKQHFASSQNTYKSNKRISRVLQVRERHRFTQNVKTLNESYNICYQKKKKKNYNIKTQVLVK